MELALTLGLRGVGELHPGVQRFHAGSEAWQALARWCAAHGWPVNCHATAEKGPDHPSAVPTPLHDYVRMAKESPELKLILAHWGGGLALHGDVLPDNLYLDCSASPLLYPMDVFREVIDNVGLDRIFYGSDYPLRIFPRKHRRAEMSTYLQAIRAHANLTDTETTALLGENFRRILKG